MMTRAWLILVDTLVYLLLLLSLILFYLNPPSYSYLKKSLRPHKTYCPENSVVLGKLPFSTLELNATMTLDELSRIGQQCRAEEYSIEKNIFLESTLEERLHTLLVKKGAPVFIRIFKEEAILEIWIKKEHEYVHLKDYVICAMSGNLGPKLVEGDMQAPEGFYKVHKSQLNPKSKFHLSFNLGYPNAYDRMHKRTGSFLMVHGNCVSAGCFAMTDEKIEEIYALVEAALNHGQRYIAVHAFPFRMSDENMQFYEGNEWYDFWTNLKEGYDYFSLEKVPPKIKVKHKKYEILEK